MNRKRKRQIAHIWIKNELKREDDALLVLAETPSYFRQTIREIAKAVKLSYRETLGIAVNIISKLVQKSLA